MTHTVVNRIGPEHGAFPMIMMNFAAERLMLAGQCVAIAELAYREANKALGEKGSTVRGIVVNEDDLERPRQP